MGTYTTIVTGLGVIIDLAKFDRPKAKVPSCSHSERIGNVFCPICGVRVGEKTDYSDRTLANELNEAFHEESFDLPKGYLLAKVGYEDQRWFLGFGQTMDPNDTDGLKFAIASTPNVGTVNEVLINFRDKVSDLFPDANLSRLVEGEIAFVVVSRMS